MVRLLAAILTVSSGSASAQEGFKLCQVIKNDGDRLKCYDGLAALANSVAADKDGPIIERKWEIKDEKSPLDDSPLVNATLTSDDGKSLLGLRCRERGTDAVLMMQNFIECGSDPLRVTYRLDQNRPIETHWSPAASGCRAAFATAPIPFIRALGEGGKLYVRLFDRKGVGHDAMFSLGSVSEVRARLAEACQWDVTPKPAQKPAPKAAAPSGPPKAPKAPLAINPN